MSARDGNPKMQRAHFQLIADVLRECRFTVQKTHNPVTPAQERHMREELAKQFAGRLGLTNSAFNYARFMSACMEGKSND